MAVVDPQSFKFRGLEGLRVADASVIAIMIFGNIQTPKSKTAFMPRGRTSPKPHCILSLRDIGEAISPQGFAAPWVPT
jgi:hypothetical protein